MGDLFFHNSLNAISYRRQSRQACEVGNTNSPSYILTGGSPVGAYSLAFDPDLSCGVCPVGFRILNVHFVFRTTDPCQVTAAVNLSIPDYPDSPDCPTPGTVVCASSSSTFELTSAGAWEIILPIDCECAAMGSTYLLGVSILETDCPGGSMYFDAAGEPCTSYIGEADVYYLFGGSPIPGNLVIWADADCCESPVAGETQTWGNIKGLYH